MENTEKILFEDDTPQWYVAMGERWIGPLTAADVYERVLAQELTWAHYVWKQGQSEWKRICDVKTFQAAVPTAPAKAVLTEVKAASKPTIKQGARKSVVAPPPPMNAEQTGAADTKIWFLYFNDAQYGPFSRTEIANLQQAGKITPRVHAWREGMGNWDRIERISELKAPLEKSGKIAKKAEAPSQVEQRAAPRRPLVAKIILASGDAIRVGMCRDISVGGMQVLMDQLPGPVGTRVKLNVSPAGTAPAGQSIEPFVAEGVVVRILEDRRGFSFRFEKLNDNAKRSIERYLESR